MRLPDDRSTVRDRWQRQHRTISTDGLGEGDWPGGGMLLALAALDLRDELAGECSEACVCSWSNDGWFMGGRTTSRT